MPFSDTPKSPAQSAGRFLCNHAGSTGRVDGLPKAVALPGNPHRRGLGLFELAAARHQVGLNSPNKRAVLLGLVS